MTDERRWKIYVCPGCGTVTDYDRSTGCGACEGGPMTVPVVVVPVSSAVPITRLRAWIEIAEHEPSHVFALFSGGNDSTVLTSWARMALGQVLTAAAFIDTGTALPGVREFVESYCADRRIPLRVYEAGDEYDALVREHGFPGPASHRYAYIRLKERSVERLVREHKQHRRDRIMLLTGVRRSESVRRMGTTAPVRREGATVWVAPLIDWTDHDMRDFRALHALPQSDVASLIHRSGECNCGAFAAPGEREELRSLWPSWWEERIAPLERATGCRWGERPAGSVAVIGGPLCSSCDARQEAFDVAA